MNIRESISQLSGGCIRDTWKQRKEGENRREGKEGGRRKEGIIVHMLRVNNKEVSLP